MTETEEWAVVPGHPFMASTLGRIRNQDRTVTFERNGKPQTCKLKGRLLRPHISANGYFVVAYKERGVRQKFLVHRMICLAFNSGFEPGHTVNHINGIKTDNRPENLEWCSVADNTRHQWRIGLVNLRGQNNPCSKLTDAQADEIRASKERAVEVANRYGVSSSLVYMIRQGRKRRPVHGA